MKRQQRPCKKTMRKDYEMRKDHEKKACKREFSAPYYTMPHLRLNEGVRDVIRGTFFLVNKTCNKEHTMG